MIVHRESHSIAITRWAFVALETLLVLVTLAALTNNLLDADWGLSWSTFFIGVIGSTWALVIYQLIAAHMARNESDS
ncbi:hypothetical protein [Novosphingobium sp.]|uniref:hypothetical protein n=1 Tax=Novosphingobium sp. TaxID=1874826 RepID=UPI002FE0943A